MVLSLKKHQPKDLQSRILGLLVVREMYRYYVLLGTAISCHPSQKQQVAFRKRKCLLSQFGDTHLRELFSEAASLLA